MAQSLYNLKKGQDADLGAVTADSLAATTIAPSYAAAAADGAISVPGGSKTIVVTKGTAAALTLANPTATTHDGVRLLITSATAAAHTVSNAAGAGFNGGGAGADVATFGGAIGDSMEVVAYQGKWYVVNLLNVTLG